MGYSDTSRRKPPLSRHPAFVPLIAVWLAALLCGSIAVMPAQLIRLSPIDLPHLALAGAAAVLGGAVGWVLAKLFAAAQSRQALASDAPVEVMEATPVEPLTIAELEAVEELGDEDKEISDEPTLVAEVGEEAAAEESIEPEQSDTAELDPLSPSEVDAFAHAIEIEDSVQPEIVEAEFVELPEVEPAFEPALEEASVYDDAPFYADVNLSELLGAPKAEAPQVDAPEPEPEPELEPGVEAEADAQNPAMHASSEQMPVEQAPVKETPIDAGAIEEAPLERTIVTEAARPAPPQHGKAVNLLREQDTEELAMPQLIERLAVAIDDQRQMAQQAAHTYSAPRAPNDLSPRLRALLHTRG